MPDPTAPPPSDRDLAGGREQLAAAELILRVFVEDNAGFGTFIRADATKIVLDEYDRRGADLAGLTRAMAHALVDADALRADLAAARDRIAALEAEQARTVADCLAERSKRGASNA